MKFLAIFCYVICLAACTGTNPPTSITPNVDMTIQETLPIPSPTATQLPTLTPTTTQTPLPTSTNNPTTTPSPTATPVPSALPDWVTDPSTNVLILGNKGNPLMSVFNAENGDLITAHEYTVLKAIGEEPGKISNVDQDTISPNGRYQIKIVHESRVSSVSIFDKEINSKTKLLNPFLNYKTLDLEFDELATAYWSPDGEFLAVIYKKYYDSDSDQYDSNLVIYKPSGEIFQQYRNIDVTWKNPWSPAMPYRILYIEGWRTPCILDIIENKATCLEVIHDWAINENISPFNYIWSPNANQVSFIYTNDDGLTGLCYIELISNDIKCLGTPEDLHFDEQFYARVHYWSPDGNYLALFFDEFGAGSDVIGNRYKVAVIEFDDNNLQLLEGEYRGPLRNPWRPLMLSQTD